jgi:MAP/microtubule affinity-regulating kinase
MKDKWMNISYEDDELKPFIEPEADFTDGSRVGMYHSYIQYIEIFMNLGIISVLLKEFLVREMKFSRDQIEDSLKNRKYDEIMATYMLLGIKNTEVI